MFSYAWGWFSSILIWTDSLTALGAPESSYWFCVEKKTLKNGKIQVRECSRGRSQDFSSPWLWRSFTCCFERAGTIPKVKPEFLASLLSLGSGGRACERLQRCAGPQAALLVWRSRGECLGLQHRARGWKRTWAHTGHGERVGRWVGPSRCRYNIVGTNTVRGQKSEYKTLPLPTWTSFVCVHLEQM